MTGTGREMFDEQRESAECGAGGRDQNRRGQRRPRGQTLDDADEYQQAGEHEHGSVQFHRWRDATIALSQLRRTSADLSVRWESALGLLLLERDHRIDPSSPARGQVRRKRGDEQQNDRHADEDPHVDRSARHHAIDHERDDPARRRRQRRPRVTRR